MELWSCISLRRCPSEVGRRLRCSGVLDMGGVRVGMGVKTPHSPELRSM